MVRFFVLASMAAMAVSAQKSFEVASIKPVEIGQGHLAISIQTAPGGVFSANGVTLKMLLSQAYGVREFQVSGGPAWLDSQRYDVSAKADIAERIPSDQLMPMLQKLLADRFHVEAHHETKEQPVYNLVVSKTGSKLKESAPGSRPRVSMQRGLVNSEGAPISLAAAQLAQQLGRPIIDKTGLTGNYDFALQWTPDDGQNALIASLHPEAAGDPNGPSVFAALQEQLGLKLESTKGPVDILVIDRADKASEN